MSWFNYLFSPFANIIGQYWKQNTDFNNKKLEETNFSYDDILKFACIICYQNIHNDNFIPLIKFLINKVNDKDVINILINQVYEKNFIIDKDSATYFLELFNKKKSFSRMPEIIKANYKTKNIKCISFCKNLTSLKKSIDSVKFTNKSNNFNNVLLSISGHFTERYKRAILSFSKFTQFDIPENFIVDFSCFEKNISISEKDTKSLMDYVKYINIELKYKLLSYKNFLEYFEHLDNSNLDNKLNKSKSFHPNFHKLIMFYFLTGLSSNFPPDYKNMRILIKKLIIFILNESDINSKALLGTFRKIEWIKFELKNPAFKHQFYWTLKNEMIQDIFNTGFWQNLDTNDIKSYISNIYIDADKFKYLDIAKDNHITYLYNISQLLKPEQIKLLENTV